MKKLFKVVGAAFVKDGKVLALRRSSGIEAVIHKYEFVGGKIQSGETPSAALMRECKEELSLDIEVGELVGAVTYDYGEFTVNLSVYFCKMLSGYTLTEHEEDTWIDCKELSPEEWAPADAEILSVLKKGFISFKKAETVEDFSVINQIASVVMHETFDANFPEGQADYMVNLFSTPTAIEKNINEKDFQYKIITVNDEVAGYFAHCPAKNYNPAYEDGTFLSKLYLLQNGRGRGITGKVLSSFPHPVVLNVKKDNGNAVNVYKHLGFRIIKSVVTDIGEGYVMDDFVMQLD